MIRKLLINLKIKKNRSLWWSIFIKKHLFPFQPFPTIKEEKTIKKCNINSFILFQSLVCILFSKLKSLLQITKQIISFNRKESNHLRSQIFKFYTYSKRSKRRYYDSDSNWNIDAPPIWPWGTILLVVLSIQWTKIILVHPRC